MWDKGTFLVPSPEESGKDTAACPTTLTSKSMGRLCETTQHITAIPGGSEDTAATISAASPGLPSRNTKPGRVTLGDSHPEDSSKASICFSASLLKWGKLRQPS